MASFVVESNHDSAMNHEDAKQARAVARKLQLKTKSAKYNYAQSCKSVQKQAHRNKPSSACERANPHRATRVAKRSSLSQGKVEAEVDMPTWSRGIIGIRKPSVSPTLRFCQSSAVVADAWDDVNFGSRRWIEDAETTAADVTDSAADSSDSQDSVEAPEPESSNSVDGGSEAAFPMEGDSKVLIASSAPFEGVTLKDIDIQAQDEDIAQNLRKQVEQEVSATKAAAEAEARAHAKSILIAAKMQAESEARTIKDKAFADACTLKARVESQAQAKADATLAEVSASVERKSIRKAALGLRQAKDLDQQRARRQCKQTREERCFHEGLDQIRSQVEAECCEVKEKAFAEANAAKAQAVAEARAIRAKARASAKLQERRGRQASEDVAAEVVTAEEVREAAERELETGESQAELTTLSSEPETEPVDASTVSVVVTPEAELSLVDVDAGWEVLPDSSLESIPGWDVIV